MTWDVTDAWANTLGLVGHGGHVFATLAGVGTIAGLGPIAGFDVMGYPINVGDATYGFRQEPSLTGRKESGATKGSEYKELVNLDTDRPLFRTYGEHFDRRAGTVIELDDARRLSFPVTKTGMHWNWTAGLMTGRDDSGHELLWVRKTARSALLGTDVVIADDQPITVEWICLAVVASCLIETYFFQIRGG